MNRLSTRELLAAGRDLLQNRGPALALVSSGATFRRIIEPLVQRLEAMPAALERLPRAALLRTLDDQHDQLWRMIVGFRSLLAGWPDKTPAMIAASEVLEQSFEGGLGEAQRPYLIEVAAASKRASVVVTHAAVFKAVPTPDGGTLKGLLDRYIAAGAALGDALAGRVDDLAARGDTSEAAALRSRLVGLLSDLRTAIRRDLEADQGLPRSLEADVLGFFDEANRLAEARAPVPSPIP